MQSNAQSGSENTALDIDDNQEVRRDPCWIKAQMWKPVNEVFFLQKGLELFQLEMKFMGCFRKHARICQQYYNYISEQSLDRNNVTNIFKNNTTLLNL